MDDQQAVTVVAPSETSLTGGRVLQLPAAIVELGEDAAKAFVEFFAAQIRNPNTRIAYGRAVGRFLGWVASAGLDLRQLEPVHVASYVELLGRPKVESGAGYAVSSIKQHLSALKMLGAFLVIRQVLPTNPAAMVRAPRHVVKVGKTPVLEGSEARELFESIDVESVAGIRDRAILGVMVYTFARISAVLALDLEDYFQVGRKMVFRFLEKGGRHHEMPAHHTLVEYFDAYLAVRGEEPGPLFLTVNRRRTGYTDRRLHRTEAWSMVRRRCRQAGLGERFSNHTFRATGITAYLKNGGALESAQYMAAHASPRTTKLYDRRAQEASLDEVERIIL